jgi:peptide/nickel transport system ATP-binding protein
MPPLLDIRNLCTYFSSSFGTVRAVDGVSLTLEQGETLGVVGESGCGKTVLSLSIMRLVPDPPGRIVEGQILLDGQDLLTLNPEQMRALRGKEISMIFQEPMTALNPVFRIGDQIVETIRHHQDISHRDAMNQAVSMLGRVGMSSPEKRVQDYPHQLSGGMRQRVMIAMALACRPRLMLADEPTTALDVTIQAQIMELLIELKKEMNTAILLITHDLGVIAESAQKAAIMYAGEIVEYSTVKNIFTNPAHPYTIGLLESIPPWEETPARDARLNTIPGVVPELYRIMTGCRFQERCTHAMAICREKKPALTDRGPQHSVRCWKFAA